jgi:uncharacterized protein (DUF433 family)/DNA-binding transcriptional MerR regulator
VTDTGYRLIGRGIYAIPEASRLTRVSRRAIRRWVMGYHYSIDGDIRKSPPVVDRDYPVIDGVVALSFLDLQEIRFVRAFRSKGVSWKVIREVYASARHELGDPHPFSTGRFLTDGHTILQEQLGALRSTALLNIIRSQFEFRRIVAPFIKELEFANVKHLAAARQPLRWWPTAGRRRVVVDPRLNFGQASLSKEGVPTAVLAQAYAVEQSIETVARWYELSSSAVRIAVEFEQQLAA